VTDSTPVVQGRSLHLVDLDDLVGRDASIARVKDVIDAYLAAARWEPDDHVVVAADCGSLGDVAFELDTGWRLLAARGADHGLLHTTDAKLVARRYDRLIVGSGDAAFADLVTAVNRNHGDAWVVAHERRLDPQLRQAASWVVTLPDDRSRTRPLSA
jgi:hypothetical protein